MVTLRSEAKGEPTINKQSALDTLKVIAKSSTTTSGTNISTKSESVFLQEVKAQVPQVLSRILRQGVSSRHDQVRVSVAELCQTILGNATSAWKTTKLPELALETCLILTSDTQGIV